MSQIDIQNAKQIRDPMTVLISMEVPEDVAVTYSGFENVKIEDAQLGQRAWPMRPLADLQGEGFALDGSRVLYDPSVTASAANGKIGIRGDVGEDVTFTVSGDSNINGLSLAATGTDRVLFKGQTATFSDGQVIIPVGSDSITLTFPAEETDRRVEVSFTLPGTSLKVTNDSIISCIVSLRSDLSIEDPTLPESELNVDIYNDVDISEAVASIPDDSPLIYSAGYPGDMSPDRKFYVAGQITWADNVLSIHAVDAVHFLDVEINKRISSAYGTILEPTISYFTAMVASAIENAGVVFSSAIRGYWQARTQTPVWQNYAEQVVTEGGQLRDLIAFAMNVLRVKNIPNEATATATPGTTHNFLFTYVDAGRPMLRTDNIIDAWIIPENDCGNVQKSVEPIITTLNVKHKTEKHTNYPYTSVAGKAGSVSLYKGGSAFINVEAPIVSGMAFGLKDLKLEQTIYGYNVPLIPANENGATRSSPKEEYVRLTRVNGASSGYAAGYQVIDENTSQKLVDRENGSIIYTQIVPWNARYSDDGYWPKKINSMEKMWGLLKSNGYIEGDDETFDLDVFGNICELGDDPLSFSSNRTGGVLEMEELIHGRITISTQEQVAIGEIYPQMAYESLLQRSNVTGSFTWKGDPRMQPRDVVEFHRLDGTVEEITLENITLHHEGGGTYAEITYRKGVC